MDRFEPEPPARDRDLDLHVEELYASLRTFARRAVRGRTGVRLLEPTEIVHELYMKLARSHRTGLARPDFLALAASVLRSVLVDHARGLATLKRGGPFTHLTLHGAGLAQSEELDVLDFDEALTKLAALDERMARVVELRFYAGLDVDDIAQALDVSPRTVDREWAMAKAWLYRELE